MAFLVSEWPAFMHVKLACFFFFTCMFISLVLTDQLMEEQKIAKNSQDELLMVTSESITIRINLAFNIITYLVCYYLPTEICQVVQVHRRQSDSKSSMNLNKPTYVRKQLEINLISVFVC